MKKYVDFVDLGNGDIAEITPKLIASMLGAEIKDEKGNIIGKIINVSFYKPSIDGKPLRWAFDVKSKELVDKPIDGVKMRG